MAAYTNGYRLSSYEQLVMQAQEIYSKYYGVYARGGSPYEMSEKKPLSADEGGRRLAEMVEKADHIAIGGASGLSASGGGDFCYGDTPLQTSLFQLAWRGCLRQLRALRRLCARPVRASLGSASGPWGPPVSRPLHARLGSPGHSRRP